MPTFRPSTPGTLRALALVAALAAPSAVSGATAEVDWNVVGFAADNVEQQLAVEKRFAEAVPEARFRHHLQRLTRAPHVAGSEANHDVADYIASVMEEAGLDVRLYPYDVYLPRYDTATSRVEIVRPQREPLNQQEDILEADRFSDRPDLLPGWNAYSASGDVTGEVVYVNYGRLQDFQLLADRGIDLEGRIVLARYGGNFRGYKAKYAEEAGAAGLLIYSDPADGGFTQGLEYPEGRHLNGSTVQRGSILTLDWTGDPLTPFEPALPVDGDTPVERLDPAEVPLPAIPVAPLPHRSAERILSQMTGDAAPRDWQGGLGLPYRIAGGEDLTVRLRVSQDRELARVRNVVGFLRGSEQPDQWILLGSHFDAWGFGALDPNGGTAMLLTLAEALGELARQGHRPKRTIAIGHWDAEEFGILGSAEWVEQMSSELDAKAVAYINADGAVTGPSFSASAAPALKALIRETTKSVEHPEGGTVHQRWVGDGGSAEPFGDLGGGSDHVGFYCHLGIPSAMLGFSGPAPVYHSNYDNFAWFERFADPDWKMGPTLTLLDGYLALRMANADVLPFDFQSLAEDSSRHLAVVERLAGISLSEPRVRLGKLLNSASRYDRVRRRALESASAVGRDFSKANDELLRIERAFVHDPGLPFGSWYRSLFASPDPTSGYAPWMFPGLRWAAEQGDQEIVKRWEQTYADALRDVGSAADRITNLLR